MAKYRPRGPKGIGGLGGLDPMAMLQQLQQQMADMEKALEEMRVTGTAGGGVVKVVMNGHHKVLEVHIAPELLEDADSEMLADLMVSAFNQALEEAQRISNEEMAALQQALGPLAGLLGM